MAVGSNVNPNFPIPGLDQSSKGFRDNFAVIKKELETLQGTTIQVSGAISSGVYYIGDSQSLSIQTALDIESIPVVSPNKSIQFNNNGTLSGNVNLIFDESNVVVGIGSSIPNSFYGLDVNKPIKVTDELVIEQSISSQSSNLRLLTPSSTVVVANYGSNVEIGSETESSLALITDSQPRVYVAVNGSVGVGTTLPESKLHVDGTQPVIGLFRNRANSVNSLFKLQATGTATTIGIGLEHIQSNWLVGMRINAAGTLSLHTGDPAGSSLSVNNAKLAITNIGYVGIGSFAPQYKLDVAGTFKSQGITDKSTSLVYTVGINKSNPEYTLDVNGDIATGNAIVSTISSVIVDTSWLTIDALPITSFRSARYTVQVTEGTSPTEQVNILECVITHANGVPYLQTIGTYQFPPPGASLGSLQAILDPTNSDFILLQFQGSGNGNKVRIQKTYLLL